MIDKKKKKASFQEFLGKRERERDREINYKRKKIGRGRRKELIFQDMKKLFTEKDIHVCLNIGNYTHLHL